MKKVLISMVLTLFLAATVSAFVPAPIDPIVINPQFDPGMAFVSCNCNYDIDTTQACTTLNGCEGTQSCQESTTCLVNADSDCENSYCNMGNALCSGQCSYNYNLCIGTCFGSPSCEDNCLDTKNDCMDDCEDNFDDCNACDGRWGSCGTVDLCCDIECAPNEMCDSSVGVCECADTTERCAADGTGDGLDNDCDGATDEICTDCVDGVVRPCTDIDSCPGTQECISGTWEICQKNNLCCGVNCPPNKVCEGSTGNCVCKDTEERCKPNGLGDNIDNDCDGYLDEGCTLAPETPPETPPAETPANDTEPPIVGGDADEHGCIGSAGYTWCETLSQCIRPWETPCPPADTTTTTPPASKPPKSGGTSLDLNWVIILLIVIIVLIGILAAIKMMKGKPKAAAPQPAQSAPAQPPQ